jgi:hypothetical protein
MEMIRDLKSFGTGEFTLKIMQGCKLRAMLSFEEHKKPSKE